MSIVDKLTYLQTTKQLLKTEINKINNVLTDNSTFRSYPQELFNGYLDILNNGTDTLWNNLEKVSATGEEATLENVETAPIKMVLNGNTSQDGTPTPDTPVEVKVVKGENVVSVSGKNLLNVPSTFSVTTSANITASLNAGTYTISLEDYETNVEVGSSFLFQFLKDNTLVTDAYLTMSYKKTTKAIPSEVDKIRIYASSSYNNSNGKTTTFKNLMIEQNSIATPYVPYSKTDYTINLGTLELCKIRNYQDYLYKNNGKWYVHKEIGKYFYNDDLTTNGITADRVDFLTPVLNVQPNVASVENIAFCNMMSANSINKTGLNGTTGTSKIRIGVSTNYGTTYDEIKNIFANFNLTIYYVLATPTETEITNTTLIEQLEAISNAKSVKDKTYITQTNDELPFILDVEAIKEYSVE